MDDLDRRLIDLFATDPRVGVLEASRRLGVARGTVQARLDKLTAPAWSPAGGPTCRPRRSATRSPAFLTLEIRRQRPAAATTRSAVISRAIPEVLEAHTITGAGDLMGRVVARSNTDLQRVIDLVLQHDGIDRSSTVIALATQVPYRVLPLVREESS